jgi:hypothetical protein
MEHALVGLAHAAMWVFIVIFIFAAIGVFATTRWVVGLFTKTKQTVQGGISNVRNRL